MAMNPTDEKKRIANEKRLKAVQEWQKKRNQQSNLKAVHHNFVSPVKVIDKNKLNLFDSDDEDDNKDLNFDIKPQFQGQNGQLLLDKSSGFSSRFKLDERFKLDDEEPAKVIEENEEKAKNIQILESILGYEVGEKFPEERNSVKKRHIMRFDPEDENASKYLKVEDTLEEKSKKKIREKKETVKEKEIPKEQIPTSTERYIEVSNNLKEILKTASSSPFTLTAKFSSGDIQADDKITDNFTTPFTVTEKILPLENRSKFSERTRDIPKNTMNVFESKKKFTFFILENDVRLKEGVEFFQRPKPIEEIRVEWDKKKDEVLDLLRRKRKTSQKGYVTKPNASQRNKTFTENKKV